MLVALGLAVYMLGQVAPAFVPTSATTRAPPKLGGLPGAAPSGLPSADSGSAGAAILAVGVGAVAGVAGSLRRSSGRKNATKRYADKSLLEPGGGIVAYSKALTDAAAQKGESVTVTKDVMKLKSSMEDHPDTPFLENLLARNTPGISQVEEAELLIDLLKPLESKVFPAFLIFLAKKKRLVSLRRILNEYVQTLYLNQSVAPVRVTSAVPLSDEQKDKIKEKMKSKLDVDDIKLVCDYDAGLMAGVLLEWGFTDPDNMEIATESADLTMSSYLEKAQIAA